MQGMVTTYYKPVENGCVFIFFHKQERKVIVICLSSTEMGRLIIHVYHVEYQEDLMQTSAQTLAIAFFQCAVFLTTRYK